MEQATTRTLTTRCCIVGGGPAGMMLGFLLGRAGIDTLVLEKHANFLRDFRGDTVHPSTMRIMQDIGLLGDFLKRPHQKLAKLNAEFGGARYRMADMSRLDTPCPFIAFMPQWEFLDFLAEKATAFPNLQILRSAGVTDLIEENGRVTGVVAYDANGELRIEADLTIGCDGRHSTVRDRAGFIVQDIGAPIDVLWFRVTKDAGVSDDTFLRGAPGRFLITLDRGDYWQCAYVIAKGAMAQVKAQGLPAFREAIVAMAPALRQHIGDVADWDDVKLLTVTIDRLRRWSKPGVLCIGDAAHAMSPVGGVGINLAIQDAVATANLLTGPLQAGCPTDDELDAVRRRRLLPVRIIQAIQVAAQNTIIATSLHGAASAPLPIRIVGSLPWLQGVTARIIGLGIRPEHVRTPKAAASVLSDRRRS